MMALIGANPWRASTIGLGVASAGLAVALLLAHARIDVEIAKRKAAARSLETAAIVMERTAADIRAASALATAAAVEAARQTERRDAAIARKVGSHVEDRLGGIAAGVERLRREAGHRADSGGARPACVPGPSGAAVCPDGAAQGDGVLVSPDLLGACQWNTEIAMGWQQWHRSVQEAEGQ